MEATNHPAIFIAIVMVVFLGVLGGGLSNQGQSDSEREAFADYCHAEFGKDAEVYRANDAFSAGHDGLHCDHDAGTVHKNQIPQEIWEAYMAGEVDAEYVTSQLEEPPGLLPLGDAGSFTWVDAALTLLYIGLFIALIVWGASGGIPPRF